MGKIALEGIEFFAYHGYYQEERKIGNKYEVNVEISTDFSRAACQDILSGTVNYEILYKIIQGEMEIPSKVLEHLAKRIIDKIMMEFPEIDSTTIQLSKFNPSVKGVCRKAKVIMEQSRG